MNVDHVLREVGERVALNAVYEVYHGTDSPPFTQFDPARRGTATDTGLLGSGYYFSTDPAVGRRSRTLLKARVELHHPLVLPYPAWGTSKRALISEALGVSDLDAGALAAVLRSRGYDGVILDYAPVGYHHQEVVALDPEQVANVTAERVR